MTETFSAPSPITIRLGPYSFDIPRRYAAGHALSEVEAHALNGLMAENIRNNVARLMPAKGAPMLGAEALAEVRAQVLEYATGYQFAARKVPGGRFTGAFDSMCLEIVEERMGQLEAGGQRRLVGEERSAMVEKLAATPMVHEEARRRLEALREVAAEGIGSL